MQRLTFGDYVDVFLQPSGLVVVVATDNRHRQLWRMVMTKGAAHKRLGKPRSVGVQVFYHAIA